MCHAQWPLPMTSRSFSHEFAMKLLKFGKSCRVRSTAHTSFHISHNWSLPWEGVLCTKTLDLDLYLQGHSVMTLQWNCKTWHILPCPLHKMYSSGWNLSIFGTKVHYHKQVCHMLWPLTLTYIFKVIQLWLCNNNFAIIQYIFSCLLYSMYHSGWILSIFFQMVF